MQQRVLIGFALEVTLQIELGVELRRRITTFLVTVENEMLERINFGCRDILVRLKIVSRIELRDRAEWPEPILQIMRQRVFAGWNIILFPVPFWREMWAWLVTLGFADQSVVQQRLDPGPLYIPVSRQIPGRIEKRIRPAAFFKSVEEKVFERIGSHRRDVRIRVRIIGMVEQAGLYQLAERTGIYFGYCGTRRFIWRRFKIACEIIRLFPAEQGPFCLGLLSARVASQIRKEISHFSRFTKLDLRCDHDFTAPPLIYL